MDEVPYLKKKQKIIELYFSLNDFKADLETS